MAEVKNLEDVIKLLQDQSAELDTRIRNGHSYIGSNGIDPVILTKLHKLESAFYRVRMAVEILCGIEMEPVHRDELVV